jgi:hypothetical protein
VSTNDRKLDTIAVCMGHGVQIESTRASTISGGFFPAHGLRLGVFTGSDTSEHGHTPAEAAVVYLGKADTDKLIALLQEHRARMEAEAKPVTP